MQAFVVVASRQPLSGYVEWAAQRQAIPWRKLPASQVVWWSDGQALERMKPGGRDRGSLIDLGGETEQVSDDFYQFKGTRTSDRLVVTVGRFGIIDIFDTNRYANNPKSDFLNWTED